jgi:oligoendopeptidase F
MNLLPFDKLPAHKPRRLMPDSIDLGDWKQIEPLFDRLEARAAECKTIAEFEQWLRDWSEVSAAIDQEAATRYIAMTCHTDSTEAEQAYLHFVEKIEPMSKSRQFALAKIFVAHPLREKLAKDRYLVLDRDIRLHVELFRPENVPLETEESRLSQQYQKLFGSLTVQFHGEEKTLTQMGRYLEETDRALRQEAWELVANRRLQEREKFDDVFDQLVELRHKIAANAGFENYRDYAFRKLGRFDYTPKDCEQFHGAVEAEVMPALRGLQQNRREQLGLHVLRPWDLAVDPMGRPPLRPFEEVEHMVSCSQTIFDRLDRDLAEGFQTMQNLRLLDLANRKGKAPGGYQSTLSEARLPFIFMNAVGVQRDVETILHEAGHAFHALATREEDLHPYRSAPIEFCEVASMSMELLGGPHLDQFYSDDDAARARRTHLENILSILSWIATVDAFQHWIYTHKGHSRAERTAAWNDLILRFGGDVDWTGFEDARAALWHRQLHLFIHAFYYIEYGIAQLGALQIWANSRKNQPEALKKYKEALALGGSRPLPELFKAAGCKFDFSRKTLAPLVELVQAELSKLESV